MTDAAAAPDATVLEAPADVTPFGWLGTRANGAQAVFTGSRPRESDFPTIVELKTQADFEAADRAMRVPVLTLDQIKAAKSAELDAACGAAIEAGFMSSALGTPHLYGSRLPDDQMNIGGAMVAAAVGGAGFTAPIPCSADGGETAPWPVVSHTGAQVATVFADMRAWVETNRTKNRTLQTSVAAAADAAVVNATAWG